MSAPQNRPLSETVFADTAPWALDDPEVIDRLEDDGMFEAADEIRRLQERFQHFAGQPLFAFAPQMLGALERAIKWLATTDDPRCTADLHAAEEAVRKARGQ